MDILRPIPASYPGIQVDNALIHNTLTFDHETFLKSFLYPPISKPLVESAINQAKSKLPLVFGVVKKGMIVITERVVVLNKCSIQPIPISNEPYFLNNRKVFIDKIKDFMDDYKHDDTKHVTCDDIIGKPKFSPLSHQKIGQAYINELTPYRGLLLFHGLGSGKTCSSILIAERLKPYKDIVVMLPKSLEMNYVQELKKCGDLKYELHQKWSWNVSPTDAELEERCLQRSDLVIRNEHIGLWINSGKTIYEDLPTSDQTMIQVQINKMIHKKYRFIVYNGITERNIKRYTSGGNPFDNKMVIIDEAHNFVSRINNALKRGRDKPHPSIQLYNLLLEAKNCRIVMLTGTPMINYAHEIAVLFNILRGYITAVSCTSTDITEASIREAFPDIDTFDRKLNVITVTQCPYGFTRDKTSSVVYTNSTVDNFETRLEAYFTEKGGKMVNTVKHTALPDNADDFDAWFVNKSNLKNKVMLMSRITGLSSYVPDMEQIMPKLLPIIIHEVSLSDFQYSQYKTARLEEKKSEKKKSKDDETQGSYRIKSRLLCNTTYPREARIHRPSNESAEVDDTIETGITAFFEAIDGSDYTKNIEMYSPKYEKIIKVIQSNPGKLQLLYSQFLNIEGIRLFARVLESKNFVEFNLIGSGSSWDLDIPDKDLGKPMYIIYGGTKIQPEKKELFRNIFNKNWTSIPDNLVEKIRDKLDISLFMITSAGAEGISLERVQYVHLMEPYWNPVRIDQVIGRARRICSHMSLPEREQFVQVYIYLSILPPTEMDGQHLDTLSNGKAGTTDQYLLELAGKKRTLSADVLGCIRDSAIDCSLFDQFTCLSQPTDNDYSMLYSHDIGNDMTSDKDISINVVQDVKKYYIKKNKERAFAYTQREKDEDGYMPVKMLDGSKTGFYIKGTSIYDGQKHKVPLNKLYELI